MNYYNKFLAVLQFLTVFLPQSLVSQMTPDGGQSATGSNFALYINQKITQTLSENPAIFTQSSLAAAFNAERSRLQSALITGSGSEDDLIRAEQALENFRNYAQKYKTVDNMLENALNDLRDYQANDKSSLEAKYMALDLQTSLGQATNLHDAERLLRQYGIFKATVATNGVTAGLTPGYAPYFEEILNILRNYFGLDSPQMASILQQALDNPEIIQQIYAKLKESSEEEEGEDDDDADEDEDYIWDILESFKDL